MIQQSKYTDKYGIYKMHWRYIQGQKVLVIIYLSTLYRRE